MLHRVGLEASARRHPDQLPAASDSEWPSPAPGRRPAPVLLDEPLASLDMALKQELPRAVWRAADQGPRLCSSPTILGRRRPSRSASPSSTPAELSRKARCRRCLETRPQRQDLLAGSFYPVHLRSRSCCRRGGPSVEADPEHARQRHTDAEGWTPVAEHESWKAFVKATEPLD
jgi:hypothetical protein